MAYQEAWDYQTRLHDALIERKRKEEPGAPVHHLLFVEHPPVYTLGKSGSLSNLLIDEDTRSEKGISFYRINRGGDITYHGPGQIVVYPIFDLDHFRTDVRWYVHHLEEAVIQTMKQYGVQGKRMEKHTGVWIDVGPGEPERKICAVGVHLSRWVSLHGIAFNVNTDLEYFNMIIPCGITDRNKTVASLSNEVGRSLDMDEVKGRLKLEFAKQFDFDFI
jgi:lipoyl(octanoyl) transferase